MTTFKFINSYYANGYGVAGNTVLDITAKGGVGGTGVYSNYPTEIANYGRVTAAAGLSLIHI